MALGTHYPNGARRIPYAECLSLASFLVERDGIEPCRALANVIRGRIKQNRCFSGELSPDTRPSDHRDNLLTARAIYSVIRKWERENPPLYTETDRETAYGHTSRLSFSIRVF